VQYSGHPALHRVQYFGGRSTKRRTASTTSAATASGRLHDNASRSARKTSGDIGATPRSRAQVRQKAFDGFDGKHQLGHHIAGRGASVESLEDIGGSVALGGYVARGGDATRLGESDSGHDFLRHQKSFRDSRSAASARPAS